MRKLKTASKMYPNFLCLLLLIQTDLQLSKLQAQARIMLINSIFDKLLQTIITKLLEM